MTQQPVAVQPQLEPANGVAVTASPLWQVIVPSFGPHASVRPSHTLLPFWQSVVHTPAPHVTTASRHARTPLHVT
jgi:hypothetical protein